MDRGEEPLIPGGSPCMIFYISEGDQGCKSNKQQAIHCNGVGNDVKGRC